MAVFFRTSQNLEELRRELQLGSLLCYYNSLEISLTLIANIVIPPKKVHRGRITSRLQADTSKKRTNYRKSLHSGDPYLERIIKADDSDPEKLICTVCNISMLCESLSLHLSRKVHQGSLKTEEKEEVQRAIEFLELKGKKKSNKLNMSQEQDVDDEEEKRKFLKSIKMVKEANTNTQKNISFPTNDKIHARFQVANFLINHNLPFSLAQDLWKFIQDFNITHSIPAQQTYTINAKHLSKIVGDCIRPSILRKTPKDAFSISIYEGSPQAGEKFLAINARHLASETHTKTVTTLIDLI